MRCSFELGGSIDTQDILATLGRLKDPANTRTPPLRYRHLSRPVALAVMMILTSCSSEGDTSDPTGPPPVAQPVMLPVTLSATSGSPNKVVLVTFPSNRPSGETSIQATLGTDAVVISVVDSLTGAFAVPETTVGQRQLEIPLAALEIGTASFSILAAPVIANPEQVVDERIAAVTEALDSLVTQIEQGLLSSLDAASAAGLSAWVAQVQDGADQLTTNELRMLAGWLEANSEILGSGNSSASGALLAPDWASWESFWASVVTRKIFVAQTIVACTYVLNTLGWTGVPGLVAVGACVMAVVAEAVLLAEDMVAQFEKAVVPLSAELDESSSQLSGAAGAESPQDSSGTEQASSTGIEIDHATPRSLRILATYRPLRASDGAIARDVIGIVNDLQAIWADIAEYVPAAPAFPSLFSAGGEESFSVESGSVSLSSTVGQSVTCTAEPIDSGVEVDCRNSSQSAQSVTLGLTHTNRYGSVSTSVPVTVYPPQPVSATIVGGNAQAAVEGSDFAAPLEVKLLDGAGAPVVGYPVSWIVSAGSGTIVSSDATTDDSGVARAQVQAGAAGSMNVAFSSTDRHGNLVSTVFDLTSAGVEGSAVLSVSALSGTTFFAGTDDNGGGFIGTQCSVSLVMAVQGNAPIQWVRRGFTISPLDGSQTFTETTDMSSTSTPPGTIDWLTDWRFWNGGLSGFSQDMWVEYQVGAGSVERTSTSWTCDPPAGSATASVTVGALTGVSTFNGTDDNGDSFVGSQCNVTLNVGVQGSVPVVWLQGGFTIRGRSDGNSYTESFDLGGTATLPPATLAWLSNWRFWNGDATGFTMDYWVDYKTPKGSTQRTETSWTCQP
jgi:Big-like domain-containing protein